jgi:hypothetical protein
MTRACHRIWSHTIVAAPAFFLNLTEVVIHYSMQEKDERMDVKSPALEKITEDIAILKKKWGLS